MARRWKCGLLVAVGLELLASGPTGAQLGRPAPEGGERTRISVSITPEPAAVALNRTRQFKAKVTGSGDPAVSWSVEETTGGTITPSGLYLAPALAGTCHVVATSRADPLAKATVTVVVASLENTIKAKLQAVLPPEEQDLTYLRPEFTQDGAQPEDPLGELDVALDGLADAFQEALDLQAAQTTVPGAGLEVAQAGPRRPFLGSFGTKFSNYVTRIKGVLSGLFGTILDAGRRAFLNSGMGYSAGYVGGVDGSLTIAYGAGATAEFFGGRGTEYVFDFRNFQHATFPTLQCAAGGGIALGHGLAVSGGIQSILFENWIFGFEKSVTEYQGPFLGADVSVGLRVGLVAGLGLGGSVGYAGSYADQNPGPVPGSCGDDFHLNPLVRLPVTTVGYSVGLELAGTLGAGLTVPIVGSLTKSFTPPPIAGVTSYLGHGTFIAGLRMAAAILRAPTGTLGLRILAAGASVLYGLVYDEAAFTPEPPPPGALAALAGAGFR